MLMTVGVVLAAITVYHLYIPTPPELEQPLTYKFVAAGFKVIDDIGHVRISGVTFNHARL